MRSDSRLAQPTFPRNFAEIADELDLVAIFDPARKHYPWLLSEWDDLRWEIEVGRSEPQPLTWNRKLPNGSRLGDDANAELLQTLKQFAAIQMEQPLEFMRNGRTTAIQRTHKLLVVGDWLISRGHHCFSDVTPSDIQQFIRYVSGGARRLCAIQEDRADKKLTDGSILEYFRILKHLYQFRAARDAGGQPLLGDGLLFDPFLPSVDPIALARSLGAEVGRTRTLPPRAALEALNTAIEWVMDHASDLLELSEKAERAKIEAAQNAVPRSGRPTKEEISWRLANFVTLSLDGKNNPPRYKGTISKTTVARYLGVVHSVMYRNTVCIDIFERWQSFIDADDDRKIAAEAELRSALRSVISARPAQRAAGPTPRSTTAFVAAAIGLPFSGTIRSDKSPWPIDAVSATRHADNTLEGALITLWTACFIVVAILMADRLEELRETNANCIDSSRPDGPYFRNTTWKESDRLHGKESDRPCPIIVERAVQVLIKLGEPERSKAGSDKLFFTKHRLGGSLIDQTTIRARLLSFFDRFRLSGIDLEEFISVAPHQFRRFFVQASVWNYEIGVGLPAIKQHLRQEDIGTAYRYAASAKMGEMINEEQRALTIHIMEKAAFDGLELKGAYGEYLRRVHHRLKLRLVDEESEAAVIKRYIERNKVTLIPNPWGYCAFSPARAKFAKCGILAGIRNPSGPVEAYRVSACCGGCVNFLTHDGFRPFWIHRAAQLKRTLAVPNLPEELRQAAKVGLTMAQRYAPETNCGRA